MRRSRAPYIPMDRPFIRKPWRSPPPDPAEQAVIDAYLAAHPVTKITKATKAPTDPKTRPASRLADLTLRQRRLYTKFINCGITPDEAFEAAKRP